MNHSSDLWNLIESIKAINKAIASINRCNRGVFIWGLINKCDVSLGGGGGSEKRHNVSPGKYR